MKFFKNELVNREKNYNGLFNANPNIGIMNPLEERVLFFLFYWWWPYFNSFKIKKWLKMQSLIHRNQMSLLSLKKNDFNSYK